MKLSKSLEFVAPDKSVEVEVVKKIRIFISGYKFENENEKQVYNALRRANDFERNGIALDICVAYCDANRIAWGTICNIRCIDYQQGDEGHCMIEAIIEDCKFSA